MLSYQCIKLSLYYLHYNDVIMSMMASQITSLAIVNSAVYSGADQRKHQSSASQAFVRGNSPVTGEFPAQRASKVKKISIWWRHHGSSLWWIHQTWGFAAQGTCNADIHFIGSLFDVLDSNISTILIHCCPGPCKGTGKSWGGGYLSPVR